MYVNTHTHICSLSAWSVLVSLSLSSCWRRVFPDPPPLSTEGSAHRPVLLAFFPLTQVSTEAAVSHLSRRRQASLRFGWCCSARVAAGTTVAVRWRGSGPGSWASSRTSHSLFWNSAGIVSKPGAERPQKAQGLLGTGRRGRTIYLFFLGGAGEEKNNTPVNTVLNVHKAIRLIRDREKREKGVWSVVVYMPWYLQAFSLLSLC